MRASTWRCALLALPMAGWTSPSPHCGTERWPVKTFQDADTAAVVPYANQTTVTALTALTAPAKAQLGSRRVAPIEVTTYTVDAILVRRIHERDRDIHLVLADPANPSHTLIAEIPDPACTKPNRHRAEFAAARSVVASLALGSRLRVVGIGFWDFPHGQNGVAPNAIELHPVLHVEPLLPLP